jgi:hypothetical protein
MIQHTAVVEQQKYFKAHGILSGHKNVRVEVKPWFLKEKSKNEESIVIYKLSRQSPASGGINHRVRG